MDTQINIYAISGRMGSGKNHISEQILIPMLPPQPTLFLSFANHFKMEAIVKDGLDRERVFGQKDALTRQALQKRGTEEGRAIFGKDIWLSLGLEWLYAYLPQGYTRFAFSDVRFQNEADGLRKMHGRRLTVQGRTYQFHVTLIRVNAPKRSLARANRESALNQVPLELLTGHASENDLDNYPHFDYEVDNDYDDDVYPAMKGIARDLLAQYTPERVYVLDLDDTICHCHVYYQRVIDFARESLQRVIEVHSDPQNPAQAELNQQLVLEYYAEQEQALYLRPHAGVFRRLDFPADLTYVFTQTLLHFKLYGEAENELANLVFDTALNVFNQPYEALPGALDAVKGLQELGQVVLYTHGDRIEQAAKVARLGLSHLPLFVTPNKGSDALLYLMAQYPAQRGEYVVIGDNFHRDVEPALAVGVRRVYWVNNLQGRAIPKHVVQVDDLASAFSQERYFLGQIADGYAKREAIEAATV